MQQQHSSGRDELNSDQIHMNGRQACIQKCMCGESNGAVQRRAHTVEDRVEGWEAVKSRAQRGGPTESGQVNTEAFA